MPSRGRVLSSVSSFWPCLCGVILTDEMVQRGVDESSGSSSSSFASLVQREHPLVLRRAAGSWGIQPFLEVRSHPLFKFNLLISA